MNSAAEVSVVESPEIVLSKDQYWKQNYAGRMDGAVKNPSSYNDWNYKIAKFFGGKDVSKFESEYEAYLNNINNRNEARAVQSARAYDEFMSNTAYSRAFKDLERAGVNPYLLLNSGSAPSTSVGSSSKASYSAKSTGETKSNTKGRDFALILLAIARLAAAM